MASGLRVAVTGAAGSVGTKLVERLAASDDVDSVVGFDARPTAIEHPKVVCFQQDIRQPMADILREYGVDALVHLAFLLRQGRNREAMRRVNVGGTAQALRACQGSRRGASGVLQQHDGLRPPSRRPAAVHGGVAGAAG